MTPAGIKPATFRFVAQHLNHCATAVPTYIPTYMCSFEYSVIHMIHTNLSINKYVTHLCLLASSEDVNKLTKHIKQAFVKGKY